MARRTTQTASAAPAKTKAHSLTLRLLPDGYRRLRRFAAKQEQKTGDRVTHQSIFETALDEYLTKHGAD